MGVSKRTRQKELKKNIIAVLIIVAFAFTVFSINSIGKFIAEKIIKPVADFSGIKSESISTENLKTTKLEIYLVSALEVDSLEEAQKASDEIKSQGGSGYIFEMDKKFNVLHSVKTNKDSAKEVTSSLSSGTVMTLTLDELSIKITGTKKQTDTISACFNLMTDNSKDLILYLEQLESGEITSLQASTKLNAMESKLEEDLKLLGDLNSSNITVKALTDMLSISKTLIAEMPDSDQNNFLQKFKYTACAYVCEYFKFYGELE